MWICRRCAAHVSDEILLCPHCDTPAPARLQPELAQNVSDRMNESPRGDHIVWLRNIVLPNLRKRAASPWNWVIFGFLLGLCYCTADLFRGSPSTTLPLAFVQPFFAGVVVAAEFAVLAIVLPRAPNREGIGLSRVKTCTIIGFFAPLIFLTLEAFTRCWGWESVTYLMENSLPVLGLGAVLAVMVGYSSIAVVLVTQLIFRKSEDPEEGLPPCPVSAKTDALDSDCSTGGCATATEEITAKEDRLIKRSSSDLGIRQGIDLPPMPPHF
jgi:hypothetical protein